MANVPKVPLADSFENLEQIPKQTVKQVAKLPGDIVVGAVKSLTGNNPSKTGLPAGRQVDPLTGIEVPSQQRVSQLKKREKRIKAAAIPHAQQIIAGVPKQQQPIPTYVSGKPGFSEEKMVKMHELEEKKKKELPPPVSAAKPKMGTGERKIMGSSG